MAEPPASGSIAHVLHTAFREIYSEETDRIRGKKAREEYEHLLATKRIQAEALAAAAADQKKGKKAAPVPVIDQTPPEPVTYMNSFDRLHLSEQNRSHYEQRLQEIERDNAQKLFDAKSVTSYLATEQDAAFTLEQVELNTLKRKGILVGTHIPSIPSKLQLDEQKLKSQKSVSFDFVVAKNVVNDNQVETLRRTGQLPISLAAEEYAEARIRNHVVMATETPHYLTTTGGFMIREDITKRRIAAMTIDSPKKKLAEPPVAAKKKPPHPHPSRAEELANSRVMDAMNSKLNYKRNPRNEGASITKTLIKTVSKAKDSADVIPLFMAAPKSIEFFGFSVGDEKTLSLSLKNISSVLRSVRCIPPKTIYFSCSDLVYPAQGGFIAPGMSVTTSITFRPDSLRDFKDCLTIETEGGVFEVPIRATRIAPKLSLPSTLDIGSCFIGDACRLEIPCYNAGGEGRFVLFAAGEEFRSDVFDEAIFETKAKESIRVAPFTIYPAAFELKQNETVNIYVEFVPMAMGALSQSFQMFGDNLQVKEFAVMGECRSIVVDIVSVNEVPLAGAGVSFVSDLYFKPACVAEELMQTFEVMNRSGLPLEFEWIFADGPGEGKDFEAMCNEKLALAEGLYDSYVFSCEKSRVASTPGAAGEESFEQTFNEMFSGTGGGEDSSMVISGQQQDNVLHGDSFELQPRRGIFPADGALSFDVTFAPSAVAAFSTNAVLMLKHVPRVALPGCDDERAVFEEQGHPRFYKLLSWTESLGKMIPLGSAKPHPYISLQSLLTLVQSYAVDLDDLELVTAMELFRLKVALMLKYYRLWLSDAVEASEEETATISIMIGDDGSADFTPALFEEVGVFSLQLTASDSFEGLNANDELSSVWVTNEYVLALLGDYLSAVLEQYVSHEAVQYLQDLTQKSASVIQVQLRGMGLSRHVSISPSQFEQLALPIGAEWSGSVQLSNIYSSILEVSIDQDAINVFDADNLDVLRPSDCILAFSSGQLILMPESDAALDISLQMKRLGRYEVHIPFVCSMDSVLVESIVIRVESIAPKVRFDAPEVNFNLLSVGKSGSVSLSFVNESNVPLKYLLQATLDVDAETQNAVLAHMSNQGGASGLTSRSQSRVNTHRSVQQKTGRSDGTADSFNIKDLIAHVSIDAPAGELAALGQGSITLSLTGGALPQRIRGRLRCSVFDVTGACQLPSQIITLRGEIQSPHVVLSHALVDLGDIYIGESASFSVFIENLTNLPSKYKIEKLLPDAPIFSLAIRNPSGKIGAKEKIALNFELSALTEDVAVDYVVSCKYFGALDPLGFIVRAQLKGYKVDFINTQSDEEVKSFSEISPATEAVEIPTLQFGYPYVNLYQRCSLKVLLRNLSGSTLSYTFYVRKYVSAESIKDDNSRSVRVASHTAFSYIEEPKEKIFSSDAGREYIMSKQARQEDHKYLSTGNGAAFVVIPSAGSLAPWTSELILVKAFNDSPASYSDMLICVTKSSNGLEKKYTLPMKMVVHGCPLVIDANTFGMSKSSAGSVLHMGEGCMYGKPMQREIRIHNNSAKVGEVSWSLRSAIKNVKNPENIDIEPSECDVQALVQFWEDLSLETPFRVEPQSWKIEPDSFKVFQVYFSGSSTLGLQQAVLTGAIQFHRKEMKSLRAVGSDLGGISTVSSVDSIPSNSTDSTLKLLIEGTYDYPHLRFNNFEIATGKVVEGVVAPWCIQLQTDMTEVLRTTTGSNKIVCSTAVPLANLSAFAYDISIELSGPFTIHDVTQGATPARGLSVQMTANGTRTLAIGFRMSKKAFANFAKYGDADADAQPKISLEGSMVLTFSTGFKITAAVKVVIDAPIITLSTPEVSFGTCRVKEHCESFVLLSNPTAVQGSWSFEHVPKEPLKNTRTITTAAPDNTTDDPSVFEISPSSGVLGGPSVAIPTAAQFLPKDFNRLDESIVDQRLARVTWKSDDMATKTSFGASSMVLDPLLSLQDTIRTRHAITETDKFGAQFPTPLTIRFSPKRNLTYKSRFRFFCEYGNAVDILLQGGGTYEEIGHRDTVDTIIDNLRA